MGNSHHYISNEQLSLADALKRQGHSDKVIAEWTGLDPHVVKENAEAAAPVSSNPVSSGDLDWTVIADYLSTGMSLAETATAAGITVAGLEAAYQSAIINGQDKYDSVDTWAGVLRARRHYELLKALETRALRGDLRSYVAVIKARYERFKDAPKPSVKSGHGGEYE